MQDQKNDVIKAKINDSAQYDYIADDFDIVIKTADDFKFEITRIIRESLTDTKLNCAIQEIKEIDWENVTRRKLII